MSHQALRPEHENDGTRATLAGQPVRYVEHGFPILWFSGMSMPSTNFT